MVSEQVRVYFEDEAPKIGCGWRTVEVRIGRKWVYFRNPFTGAKTRMKKAKAEPIIRSVLPLTK